MALVVATAAPKARSEGVCSRFDLTPARYENRQVEVIYEAHERLDVTPPIYKTVTEHQAKNPAHCPGTTFKVGEFHINPETLEDRLEVVPNTFKRIKGENGQSRVVVDVPFSVRRVPIVGPRRIVRRVIETLTECAPEEMIPAEMVTLQRRIIDTPGSVRREWVPESTKIITERVVAEPAYISIRNVPCSEEQSQ